MHVVKAKVCYIFNDLCKPIETYIYVRKNHPITGYPAVKNPKHNQLAVTDIREKPVDFFNDITRGPTLASIIISQTWFPLPKFPFL